MSFVSVTSQVSLSTSSHKRVKYTENPIYKRKGQHLPFRPVFDYFKNDYLIEEIDVGKKNLVLVLCSAYIGHLYLCCD